MSPTDSVEIPSETAGVGNRELTSKVGNHACWHVGGLCEKRAQEANSAELEGESKLVVVTVPRADVVMVGLVKMKVPGQLVRSGLASEEAEALLLIS